MKLYILATRKHTIRLAFTDQSPTLADFLSADPWETPVLVMTHDGCAHSSSVEHNGAFFKMGLAQILTSCNLRETLPFGISWTCQVDLFSSFFFLEVILSVWSTTYWSVCLTGNPPLQDPHSQMSLKSGLLSPPYYA